MIYWCFVSLLPQAPRSRLSEFANERTKFPDRFPAGEGVSQDNDRLEDYEHIIVPEWL